MRAEQTEAAIEAALYQDQGATFRGLLRENMALVEDAFSTDATPFRSHMGASLIGRDCGREIWYGFRWARQNKFEGRMIRLFNRGHLEEARFVSLLELIGCKVWHHKEDGTQFRITGHKGHFGGSLDAVVKGVPEYPDEPMLAEFKTHGDKSFNKLKDSGVMGAKWEHFVQMTIYMGAMGLKRALYLAVNKNTDEIYAEIVNYDAQQYARYTERSIMLVEAREAPPKINQSPAWFKCKFCEYSGICHLDEMPAKNCRTCQYASIGSEPATWICGKQNKVLSKEEQLYACSEYTLNLEQFKSKV